MIEVIRKMVSDLIKPDIIVGKVKSFSESNWTVEVELNRGGTIDEVSIKSVINTEESGMYVEPEVGSYVLLAVIDGKIDNLYVLGYSQIKRVRIISELIELNGDQFGGIVKSQEVQKSDNKIIAEINELKQLIATWVPSPSDGGAALKSVLATWSSAALPQVQQSVFENEKVKHG